MNKLEKLVLGALMLFGSIMYAQTTVSGTVSDNEGPLPGVNVIIKGTQTGTSTDFDGNYSLDNVSSDAVLEFSSLGFITQDVAVGTETNINVTLVADAQALEEIVLIGYGSTTKKEITSAITKVKEEDFNQGTVNDPAKLLQGKVAGLSVYNKGGDPNSGSVIRIRGISTIGANTEPLVVIDGIAGGDLANVDPADIESVNVLKDGSAAAIYGTRGSSGVIIVTTKKGRVGGTTVEYSGSVAASSIANSIDVMTADEFIAAGLTNLQSKTDWTDEVTRTAISQVHNIAVAGGHDNTTYRVSANFRDSQGIVDKTGFDQFNARANISTRLLNDKLKLDFNSSYSKRNSQFGDGDVMKYATLYNPTAPVLGADAPFEFNEEQYGGYFETLGLFDSYNPVSIMNQLYNEGVRTTFNYNLALTYDFTDRLSAKMAYGEQSNQILNRRYAPTTLLRGGNASSPTRKGDAQLYSEENDTKFFDLYATYQNTWGSMDATFTVGYNYQERNQYNYFLQLGDFPDDSMNWVNRIQESYDLREAGFVQANSFALEDDRIVAFFGRVNLTWNNSIFFNASLRQEGSSRFGEDEKWGLFPSVGVGVDLNHYLNMNNVDLFKFRVGYGVTGALPGRIGLSQLSKGAEYSSNGGFQTINVDALAANPTLGWEKKAETNIGVEFNMGRLTSTIDWYTRTITDFILEQDTSGDPDIPEPNQFQNSGELKTNGFELAVNYDIIKKDNLTYNAGIVFSTFSSDLVEYNLPNGETRGGLGSPGQNSTNMILVRPGESIGQIWGPVWSGEIVDGNPQFVDVNGDGVIITGQDKALDPDVDFAVLGNGIPDFEYGWTNQLSFGNWTVNAFFRGAVGHSLVNSFRAFYEPRVSSQSSYNLVNTELANDEITSAQFSSLYVEKADFFKLDNLSLGYNFNLNDSKYFEAIRVMATGQNVFTITNYTGADPEPALQDTENNGDVLAPGIDRRGTYFAARTFTLGLNITF